MKRLALLFGIIGVTTFAAKAQETPRFAFNVGGGFTQAVGNTGRHLDTGWNVGIGAGYNFHPRFGVLAQASFNNFGINGPTLANIGFPDGTVRVFSATLNPIVHLAPKGPVDVYLIGGGGFYRRTQEFTQPAVTTAVGFDPFFGFYRFAVPVNEVLSSYSVNKPGVNGGMGFAFGTKWHAKFYMEARYHRILMGNNQHTDYVPVTFGVRW
ncbi:MAG: outer membrane beta-barrel protein [Bryobacteraceae bacterium]